MKIKELTEDQRVELCKKAPLWACEAFPELMCYINPQWLNEYRPEILAEMRFTWLAENNPNKAFSLRPIYMARYYEDWVKKNAPDFIISAEDHLPLAVQELL